MNYLNYCEYGIIFQKSIFVWSEKNSDFQVMQKFFVIKSLFLLSLMEIKKFLDKFYFCEEMILLEPLNHYFI